MEVDRHIPKQDSGDNFVLPVKAAVVSVVPPADPAGSKEEG